MATAEFNTAHPVHNKLDATRRNAWIAGDAANPWKVIAKPQWGDAFIATRFSVDDEGALWATDSEGNGYIVIEHWLQTNFKPCPRCPYCDSKYVPCECNLDN